MPVYNVGPYLDACLLSVRYQSFTDFELIVINDASEDNSLEIIEMHAALDKRIQIINIEYNTLGGAGIPSNIGLEMATGKYIGFVDSDDWVTETAFESLVAAAEVNKADIVIGDFCTFIEKNRNYSFAYDLNYFNEIPNNCVFNSNEYPQVFRLSPVPWRKLYRHTFLEKNNIRYPEGDFFYEDNPLHWLVLCSNPKIVKINKIISYHRMERENQTMSAGNYRLGAMCTHLNTIGRFLNEKTNPNNKQLFYEEFYDLCYRLNWFLKRQNKTDVKKIIGKQFAKVIKRNLGEYSAANTHPDFYEKFNLLDSDYPDIDLTIVIPTYNSEQFIKEIVNKLLTVKNIKINILIIDDGSEDRTVNICSELEQKHKNVHFFEQKNNGSGRARNALIPLCTGNYTFFISANASIDTSSLELAVTDATNNGNDLYFMKYKISIDNDENHIEMYNSDRETWRLFSYATDNNDLRNYASKLISHPWNRIIKTELLFDANIFFGPTIFHNDLVYHWESILSAKKIGYTDDTVYTHKSIEQNNLIINTPPYNHSNLFDTLELVYNKIKKHPNGKQLHDTWISFASSFIEKIKDKIPQELEDQYQKRRKHLMIELLHSKKN